MNKESVFDGRWGWRALPTIFSLIALGTAIGLAVSIGEISIPPVTILKVISNRLLGTEFLLNPVHDGIVWNYRLSRALVAAATGAALAQAGVILQALLRNPLAEPYLLGVSAGASTGAVSVLILGLGSGILSLSGGAFVGAVTAFLVVSLLAAGTGGTTDRLILAGVAGSQLFNALTSWIVTMFASAEQSRGVMFWLLGSLGGVRWPDVYLAAPIALASLVISLAYARVLDAFTFGADAAAALGVSVQSVRATLFGLTAVITAAVVSIVGSIGFVGLVVPHAVRIIVGPRHSRVLPASWLTGANFMVVADILSRVIVPQQVLPVGVVTALFGAPVFAILLYRSGRPR